MINFTFSTLIDADPSDADNAARLNELADLDLVSNFSFDFDEALGSLDSDGQLASLVNQAPTTISNSTIAWGDATNGIAITGLDLNGISDVSFLEAALEAGLAQGQFSSIDATLDGNVILSIESTATDFTLTSGNQSVVFSGELPSTVQDLFNFLVTFGALSDTGLTDFSNADFNNILSVMDQFGLSSVSIAEGENTVAQLSFDLSAVTLNIGGAELALNGTFDIDSLGDLLSLLRTELASGQAIDLSQIDQLALTDITLTGADGTKLVEITGTFETEADLENGLETVTMVGTDGDDRDVQLDSVSDFFANEARVELGAGRDELEIQVNDFLDVIFDNAPMETFVLDGAAPGIEDTDSDELDFSSDGYGIYTIDMAAGQFTALADPNAIYGYFDFDTGTSVGAGDFFNADNAVTFVDFTFTNFEDVDLDFFRGELTVIGNDENNLIDVQTLPDSLEIDGGAGVDRVKFDNLFAELRYTETENGIEVERFTTLEAPTVEEFSEFFGLEQDDDGWINVTYLPQDAFVGRVRNVEEFEFALTEDENEIFTVDDLFPQIVIVATDEDGDVVVGNDADNVLTGLGGDDVLNGGNGDDLLDGGGGRDRMVGGFGNDIFIFENKRDRADEGVDEGFDIINATAEVTLAGAEIEEVNLLGTRGHRVNGNEFATEINGNSGSNIIIGGGGGDVMTGGDGNDFFAFLTTDAAGAGLITDFTDGDQVALDDRFFNLGDGTIDVRQVTQVQINNALRTETAVYNAKTGEMFIDRDGRGGPAEAELIAVIEGGGKLGVDDFLLF